jgi:CO dehydrogenase maturation factor
MILGFLGKGGSGKSSVSTQMALYLHGQGKNILAIDADHNMDLSYNLTGGHLPTDMHYLGSALGKAQMYAGLGEGEHYTQAFTNPVGVRFSFSENSKDSFTAIYALSIKERLHLMSAGPQTDQVLFGQSCSHILTTSLKIYLPLLELTKEDEVIVDEKAGADGVTTGIVTGMDVAVIVCEPALHSIKTAKQISELLHFYQTPYLFVGNKITSTDDKHFIEKELGQTPIYLASSARVQRQPDVLLAEWQDMLALLYTKAQQIHKDDRLERTMQKFKRESEFNHAHQH